MSNTAGLSQGWIYPSDSSTGLVTDTVGFIIDTARLGIDITGLTTDTKRFIADTIGLVVGIAVSMSDTARLLMFYR